MTVISCKGRAMAPTQHIRTTVCPFGHGEVLVKELHHRFDQGDEIQIVDQVSTTPRDGSIGDLRAKGSG